MKGSKQRWFGPGRASAAETRSTEDGMIRRPGNIAWFIAQGRLKKAHTSQLRHASLREKLVAEATSAPTLPWTFATLGKTLDKGQYEDLTKDLMAAGRSGSRGRQDGRSQSRGPPVRRPAQPVVLLEPPVPQAAEAPAPIADDSEEELIPALPVPRPTSSLPATTSFEEIVFRGPIAARQSAFRRARREHELDRSMSLERHLCHQLLWIMWPCGWILRTMT